MKKTILFSALGFFAIASVLFSCKKPVDCAALVAKINEKAAAYAGATSANQKQACKDYRAALEAWVKESKCTDGNATTKAAYEALINQLKTTCP